MNELEFETVEVAVAEVETAVQQTEAALQELAQCDLMLIGGGSGNVIF
jgi:hypothetical protein